MKVFVEFVGSVFFVDLKLSQNPYMPTTRQLLYRQTTYTLYCPSLTPLRYVKKKKKNMIEPFACKSK